MSREQRVRDAAYAIWEAEGRPEGREADHWRLAEERVAKREAKTGAAKDPAAPKGRSRKEPAAPRPAPKTRTKRAM